MMREPSKALGYLKNKCSAHLATCNNKKCTFFFWSTLTLFIVRIIDASQSTSIVWLVPISVEVWFSYFHSNFFSWVFQLKRIITFFTLVQSTLDCMEGNYKNFYQIKLIVSIIYVYLYLYHRILIFTRYWTEFKILRKA